jgi:predicted acetyltransferase
VTRAKAAGLQLRHRERLAGTGRDHRPPSGLALAHRSPPLLVAPILRGGVAAMSDTASATRVVLEEVGLESAPVLRRLMQLYLYDLGSLDGWNISSEGLYGSAERIERFWTEPGRRCFLIRADAALAGFAFIRDEGQHSGPGTWEVSEFFVLRKFRRQGVGTRAALMLFDLAPGPWEVSQLASNLPAQLFWRAVIDRYTAGHFSDEDDAHDHFGHPWRGRVQRFQGHA